MKSSVRKRRQIVVLERGNLQVSFDQTGSYHHDHGGDESRIGSKESSSNTANDVDDVLMYGVLFGFVWTCFLVLDVLINCPCLFIIIINSGSTSTMAVATNAQFSLTVC